MPIFTVQLPGSQVPNTEAGTIQAPGNGKLEYFYEDSGAPAGVGSYTTFFMLHGYCYHSGIFQRLFPLAHQSYSQSFPFRVIAINRRGYPPTTPFNPFELTVFESGSEEERVSLLLNEGRNYVLLLDGLIKELGIPE
ncbi:hypothetical protein D9758_012302 [Tetrapyrgos nigripes]|uniref:Uncharacterized protein n=1 Tax=Tetrapyrgos nigripes TaxID=182062 RepID=A0A8H5CGH1_9AGAR|nr:hypothetical protein D9758_012302 [Tetrapyrgos nigripes]